MLGRCRPATVKAKQVSGRRWLHGGSYAGWSSVKTPQHMQHWVEASTGNHFRYWDRMGPEDVDHAHRSATMGTWFQNLKWGDYIVVKREKETEHMCDHGIFMGHGRGICTYTRYRKPEERNTLWLGKNLMIWLEPALFALETDTIYVNDLLVYSPDPERELGELLQEDV
eukprot:TRINITY_DN876_c2_g1_i1.p1 TRINITY_DN876_c2_g1~~TRINITY_DN876_c2_g1_i1.p1  ORF type:complete len:182 (+),score=14.06 TRINITY_DN876_c2_g1_i1:41-547(+)